MTAPSLTPGDVAGLFGDGEACMVQLVTFGADGEMLMTQWAAAAAFTDVREQLSALFGKPLADASADMAVMLPAARTIYDDPATHVQVNEP